MPPGDISTTYKNENKAPFIEKSKNSGTDWVNNVLENYPKSLLV